MLEGHHGTEGRRPADRSVPDRKAPHPNPDQPRRRFDGPALAELAESIAASWGIIQSLIVRAHPHKPDHFEIVAGNGAGGRHRRRSSTTFRWSCVEFSDIEVLEVAIIREHPGGPI